MRSRTPAALAVVALLLASAAAEGHVPTRATAAKRCSSSQLRVQLGSAEAALGHIGQVVSFLNASTSGCTLDGYPDLQMLDAAGGTVHTRLRHGIAYTVPPVPRRLVVVKPGRRASFDVGYDDSTGYEREQCPTSARVEITPPTPLRRSRCAGASSPTEADRLRTCAAARSRSRRCSQGAEATSRRERGAAAGSQACAATALLISPRATSSSAIWTALSAAPLSRLSPTTNMFSE